MRNVLKQASHIGMLSNYLVEIMLERSFHSFLSSIFSKAEGFVKKRSGYKTSLKIGKIIKLQKYATLFRCFFGAGTNLQSYMYIYVY